MTEEQAIQAIYKRWSDNWPTLQPTVPFSFTNEGFASVTSFAHVRVQHGPTSQRTQGQTPYRKFERTGQIVVDLFGPVDVGRGELSRLAGSVRTIFEGVSIVHSGGDVVYTYATRTEERDEDGMHARARLFTEFRYVETR